MPDRLVQPGAEPREPVNLDSEILLEQLDKIGFEDGGTLGNSIQETWAKLSGMLGQNRNFFGFPDREKGGEAADRSFLALNFQAFHQQTPEDDLFYLARRFKGRKGNVPAGVVEIPNSSGTEFWYSLPVIDWKTLMTFAERTKEPTRSNLMNTLRAYKSKRSKYI